MEKLRFYYPVPIVEAVIQWRDGYFDATAFKKSTINSLERYTICGIHDTDKKTLTIGIASCHKGDIFNKALGRSWAYEHARNKPYCVVPASKDTVADLFMSIAKSIEKEKYGYDLSELTQ